MDSPNVAAARVQLRSAVSDEMQQILAEPTPDNNVMKPAYDRLRLDSIQRADSNTMIADLNAYQSAVQISRAHEPYPVQTSRLARIQAQIDLASAQLGDSTTPDESIRLQTKLQALNDQYLAAMAMSLQAQAFPIN